MATATEARAVVAVRGTGSIGMRHLAVLAGRPETRAIAMPLRPGAREELAPFERASDFAEAVRLGATAAIIATDTSRHVKDAVEALDAGLDVLIEKPLAPTALDLPELETALETTGRRAFVACNLRFARGFSRFRERLAEVGAVHAVHVVCQSYLPEWRPTQDHRRGYSARADEGGVLRDLVHEVDYAVACFGRPKGVFARMMNSGRLEIEAEESADLTWTTPAGAILSMRLDYLTRTLRRSMTAFGADGELEWNLATQTVTLRRPKREPDVTDVSEERNGMMRDQLDAFLAAIATKAGDPGRLATYDEADFITRLCDAARRSSRSDKLEEIT